MQEIISRIVHQMGIFDKYFLERKIALGIKDCIDISCENWLLIIKDHYGKHFIQGKFNGMNIGQYYLESNDSEKTKKNILAKCTKEIIFGNGVSLFMKE